MRFLLASLFLSSLAWGQSIELPVIGSALNFTPPLFSSGGTVYMNIASATNSGYVTTGNQTFGGNKTFANNVTIDGSFSSDNGHFTSDGSGNVNIYGTFTALNNGISFQNEYSNVTMVFTPVYGADNATQIQQYTDVNSWVLASNGSSNNAGSGTWLLLDNAYGSTPIEVLSNSGVGTLTTNNIVIINGNNNGQNDLVDGDQNSTLQNNGDYHGSGNGFFDGSLTVNSNFTLGGSATITGNMSVGNITSYKETIIGGSGFGGASALDAGAGILVNGQSEFGNGGFFDPSVGTSFDIKLGGGTGHNGLSSQGPINTNTKYEFSNATFYDGTTLSFNGHIRSIQTGTITATSCGTSPTVGSGSNDNRGIITIGSTATSCTVTFITSYSSAPYCVITPTNSTGVALYISATTTAHFVVSGTTVSSAQFNYNCMQ